MKQFKYKILVEQCCYPIELKTLQSLGDDGWELVCVRHREYAHELIFKKEVGGV